MKKIIMTGASDGLGKEFAKLCVREGIEIISLSRTKPDYNCVYIPTDLSNESSIQDACTLIKEQYSQFDALINCAAVISKQKPNKITYEELENLIRVNTISPIFLTSQLFDLIKENEADIINVGSTVGTKAYPDQCAYGTSKWGLRGTSLNFQLELAKTKCRVIQFNPGGMNTDFIKKYDGTIIDNPNEWMNPVDIASMMLYILKLPKSVEVSEITINRKKQ